MVHARRPAGDFDVFITFVPVESLQIFRTLFQQFLADAAMRPDVRSLDRDLGQQGLSGYLVVAMVMICGLPRFPRDRFCVQALAATLSEADKNGGPGAPLCR